MPESYEFVNPLQYPGWDTLLLSGKQQDIFHTSAWAAVLSETYGYEPVYGVNIDGGSCRDLLPIMEVRSPLTGVRGVSLPFTDYCTSIRQNDETFRGLLAEALKEGRRRGWKYLELRGGGGFPPEIPVATRYLQHTLGLTASPESLFKGCSENTRRNVRRAERQGVSVSYHAGLDAVREFYRLHCLTRKRHGVPPPPFRFFQNFYKFVLTRGLGTIVLASVKGRVVAGTVFLRLGDRAIYKYGASDFRYELHGANHLLMWEAIRHFASDNCAELSFGRTDLGDDGLRRFKTGWGSKEEPLEYYRYDISADRFLENVPMRGQGGRGVLSKMPVFLLRAAGAALYRHIG